MKEPLPVPSKQVIDRVKKCYVLKTIKEKEIAITAEQYLHIQNRLEGISRFINVNEETIAKSIISTIEKRQYSPSDIEEFRYYGLSTRDHDLIALKSKTNQKLK